MKFPGFPRLENFQIFPSRLQILVRFFPRNKEVEISISKLIYVVKILKLTKPCKLHACSLTRFGMDTAQVKEDFKKV